MASIQKRYRTDAEGKKHFKGYYALFRDSSRRPRQKEVSLKTRDREAARARMADLERAMSRSEYDPWAGGRVGITQMTAAEAFDAFMASRRETGSDNGVATYRAVIRPFERSLPPGLLLAQL